VRPGTGELFGRRAVERVEARRAVGTGGCDHRAVGRDGIAADVVAHALGSEGARAAAGDVLDEQPRPLAWSMRGVEDPLAVGEHGAEATTARRQRAAVGDGDAQMRWHRRDRAERLSPTGPSGHQRRDRSAVAGRTADVVTSAPRWFPDGERILYAAHRPGERPRLFVQDVAGGGPRALTPEGVSHYVGGNPIAPDGSGGRSRRCRRHAAPLPARRHAARRAPGAGPHTQVIRWAADGNALYVFSHGAVPAEIHKLDRRTGQTRLWRVLAPADRRRRRPRVPDRAHARRPQLRLHLRPRSVAALPGKRAALTRP